MKNLLLYFFDKNDIFRIQQKVFIIISIITFHIVLLSCEKENVCENSQIGILKNLTGLDGCGWIIQLADSTKLEPINLDDFEIELTEGKQVCIQFHERKDLGSYCGVGKVVMIDFIE